MLKDGAKNLILHRKRYDNRCSGLVLNPEPRACQQSSKTHIEKDISETKKTMRSVIYVRHDNKCFDVVGFIGFKLQLNRAKQVLPSVCFFLWFFLAFLWLQFNGKNSSPCGNCCGRNFSSENDLCRTFVAKTLQQRRISERTRGKKTWKHQPGSKTLWCHNASVFALRDNHDSGTGVLLQLISPVQTIQKLHDSHFCRIRLWLVAA